MTKLIKLKSSYVKIPVCSISDVKETLATKLKMRFLYVVVPDLIYLECISTELEIKL